MIEEVQGEENEGIAIQAKGEKVNVLPGGCNIYYGTYIDNYSSGVRSRYYIDDYGQLVLSSRTTGTQPSGSVCMPSGYELPIFRNDVMRIMCFIVSAIVLVVGAKVVVGRLIK